MSVASWEEKIQNFFGVIYEIFDVIMEWIVNLYKNKEYLEYSIKITVSN